MASDLEFTGRPRPRRVFVELTSEQEDRLRLAREQELAARDQTIADLKLLNRAADEDTFAGRLRRAIHKAPMLLHTLCDGAGIDVRLMGDFLRGEATLDSSAIDRLVAVLGWPAVVAAEVPAESKRS